MNLDEALRTFLVEARELLDDMEAQLLRLDGAAAETETINAIFRAAHTIKGSAGLFGLDAVVGFTHVVESLLDEVRDGTVPLAGPLVQLLLASADHIGALVDAAEGGEAVSAATAAEGDRLLAQLSAHAGAPLAPAALATGAAMQPAAARDWRIGLRFGADVLRNGMDPMSFLRYLETLGTVQSVVTLEDRLPALDALDAESCHIGLAVAFRGAVDRATLASVFEFVADDCEIEIEEVPATLPVAAPGADAAGRPKGGRDGGQLLRVDADKLDRLINLVGELIIAAAGANLLARGSQVRALQESHSVLAHLVEEVRDSALQLRMVRIGGTFQKFQRVVHDVAADLGKDIVLRLSGEDTELDKTVVEKIGDPLLHLVRNAMDHGIDPPELRAARGKPRQGTVSLNAFHDSGSIVIQVSDDGGGLDRGRIVAKAIERGLVEPGRVLEDAEAYALIFAPGFSTAEKVTNLSGRGVGMDVVRRNIEALRGTVGIASEPGRGTTVTVRLPLTLAIINGFQVAVGKAVFVVPLEMVDECVEFSPVPGRDYTDLRGQVLPFIGLRELFGTPGAPPARQNIVVVRHAGRRIGLVVDALLGETQTVIKPLSRVFAQVQGISGSSILGSGEVALILDVPALLGRAAGSVEPIVQTGVAP